MATPNSTCSYQDCERTDIIARGYCHKHYQLGVAHGWIIQRKHLPPEARLERDTEDLPNGCKVWTGAINSAGYGLITVNGKVTRAHRYAWERVNGSIPEGMLIDHICHNRACVEVTHLRLATRAQNNAYRKGANPNNRTSGVRGVTWDRKRKRWLAGVSKDGKAYYCGMYTTIEAAAKAAALKRAELFDWPDFDPQEFALDAPDNRMDGAA